MNSNALALAASLPDVDLLSRLAALAGRERSSSAELIAHLAALDARPAVFLSRGYSSLHAYCTRALRLSEDAASSRIAAARASARFPVILERLISGDLTLTAVRLLGRHLTEENHATVLEKAKGATLKQIDVLVAALEPQPDAPSLVRRLPMPAGSLSLDAAGAPDVPSAKPVSAPTPSATPPLGPPPLVRPTSPERYRVQFTIGEATHAKLRRLQTLLRREIPNGDPGAIFDRAVTLLLKQVEARKLGRTDRPRPHPAIRRKTDDAGVRTPPPASRHMPSAVRRDTSTRDAEQCGFLSDDGRRCTEREFLEFHHVVSYAKGGPATPENVSLRCRPHNHYEAELEFGPWKPRRAADRAP